MKRKIAKLSLGRDLLADNMTANELAKILSQLDSNTELLDIGNDNSKGSIEIIFYNNNYSEVSPQVELPKINIVEQNGAYVVIEPISILPPGRLQCMTPWGQSFVHPDKISDDKSKCKHVWKKYNGLSQSYEYCESCDEKRNINEIEEKQNTRRTRT